MTMALTLTLAMIVKDEEENLAQCLDSVRAYVDELVIVDTGSTDRTREVATRYGANVFQYDHRNHPESFFCDDAVTCTEFGSPGPFSGDMALGDFGAARKESFKQATGDYVVWLDADDVLESPEKLREVVADMKSRNLDMAFLFYDYARDHLGRVFYRQSRERIIRKGVADWINPVHEVLIPVGNVTHTRYELPLVAHRRKADRKSIPNRNYKILLRQVWQLKKANPDAKLDPRILFYLGQEARYIEPRRAVGFYEEYLKSSGWPEERAAAHVAIGSILEFGMLGLTPDDSYQQANKEFAVAAAEVPDNPDGVLGLARIAYLRGRFYDCINYSERGLKIGNTDSMLGMNPMDRLYRPHIYYNHALAKVGRLEEAIASCKEALKVCPDDPGVPGGASGMVSYNLKIYEEELAKQKAAPPVAEPKPSALFDKNEDVDAPPNINISRDAQIIWAMQLWKQNVAAGDFERAWNILDALPVTLNTDPVIERMRQSTARKFPTHKSSVALASLPKLLEEKRLSIVLYLGPGVEPWDPTTPNTQGLGGSETAAIEVAKNLVKLGHAVTVYAEAEGLFDGVLYKRHESYVGGDCDVFIASRTPWIMDLGDKISASLKLLWVHDIHCGPPSPQMERWLYRFDRILCLSEFHKEFFCNTYPTLHKDRVIVTRNGIDPGRFASVVPKKNHMVFSSSPNRGLDTLITNLPFIRAQVPDVELHVYYGFDTWETMMRQQNNQQQLDEIARYKKLVSGNAHIGVIWHGRVNQKELAEAFLRAKVWGYPTNFPETSCISAMEAQAAGCVPVCSRFAALGETVKYGILLDGGPQYGQQFVDGCVKLLTDEGFHASYADPSRQWAMNNLSWAGVAKDWIEMFHKVEADVRADPMPQWASA